MLARFVISTGLALAAFAQSNNELNFLSGQVDGRQLSRMLPEYVKAKAKAQLAARKTTVEAVRTEAGAAKRRDYIRRKIKEAIGPFPEKTPLNAKTVAVIDRPDHRVEKVIFESQPGFYVTANLYLPKSGSGPFPAILFPLGHEEGAKAHFAWQHVLISFARRGYVALAWDTIGQGERVQLWDADFKESKVVRSTTEHTIIGLQNLLVGDALARYTIWDGIRALDYLLSRPEVDKGRVGLTGNSGGGTHTAYIGALEDRIHVAAPSCYLTGWGRLLDTIGPQDAEQCMPPFLADGLDHGDFVLAFAPKPYLVLSAVRDFFSIQGARATHAEAQRLYDSLGAANKIAMFEADDGHGYTLPRREAAYRWFGKWLKGTEDRGPEQPVAPAHEQDLWCTPTGQVATSLGGETVFSLNQKRFAERSAPFSSIDHVRKFVSYDTPVSAPRTQSFGVLDKGSFRIEKLTWTPESGITIPALLYVPPSAGPHEGVILVSSLGKAASHSDAEQLVAAGKTVLSVDLRGYGETRMASDNNGSDWPRYFGDYESAMTAMLTGKPLVAMRAEDIAAAAAILSSRQDVSSVALFAKHGATVPALYAAAFEPKITRLWLERGLISYEDIIRNKIHKLQWENAAHGALRHYDLPRLARWSQAREIRMIDPVDSMGQLVKAEDARKAYPSANILRRRIGPLMEYLR